MNVADTNTMAYLYLPTDQTDDVISLLQKDPRAEPEADHRKKLFRAFPAIALSAGDHLGDQTTDD